MASKNSMEQTIQTLKGDNEELMKENASLKKQISGFKTSNANYKKQIAHLKQLDKEGDELNESLQEQVRELIQKKNKLEAEAAANKDYITELEATVEDLRKPWWKKLF